jgi:large subunit ribosomal protein L29
MKASQIRELDLESLARKEIELREELFQHYLQKGSGQLTKNDVFKKIRKDIARVKTIVTEKKKAQAAAKVIEG